jgi:hypothetical protein
MADWRNNLDGFFAKEEVDEGRVKKPEFDVFITDVVLSAFEEIREEMERHDRLATIREAESSANIIVYKVGEEEISYRVHARTLPTGVLPVAEIRCRERKGLKLLTVESMIRNAKPNYALSDITTEDIIDNFVDNYTKRVRNE